MDRILAAATAVVVERGPDLATMTEIARRADVAMASLYQYFPDKRGVLAALFERHADEVRTQLTQSLAGAQSLDEVLDRFGALARRYFQVHRKNASVRSLWAAVQVDPTLQALDAADSLRNARLLYEACRPFYAQVDEARLMAACALAMQLCAAAAQFALAIPEEIAMASADVYAEMATSYLKALDRPPAA